MKVRARRLGTYGEGKAVCMRYPGQVFEVPDNFKVGHEHSWLERVADDPPPATKLDVAKPEAGGAVAQPPAKKKAMDTMSEMTKFQAREDAERVEVKTATPR